MARQRHFCPKASHWRASGDQLDQGEHHRFGRHDAGKAPLQSQLGTLLHAVTLCHVADARDSNNFSIRVFAVEHDAITHLPQEVFQHKALALRQIPQNTLVVKFHRIRSWYSGALMWTVAVCVYIYIYLFIYIFIYLFIYLFIKYLFVFYLFIFILWYIYIYVCVYCILSF